MKRGIWFAGEVPVPRMVELARRAEAAGLDSAWMAEGYYARDGLVPLAAMATATSRVQLGTIVINPFTRHPAVLAMSFATLDELSGGRAVIGIGSGARHQVEDQMGYQASKQLTAVRESLDVLEPMGRGERVDFEGRVITARGVELAIEDARPLPIYIAAAGPKMLDLAGERAAGVFIPHSSPEFVRHAVKLVAQGAEAAGRDPSDVDVASSLVLAVHEDKATAEKIVRPLLALLLLGPEVERLLEENGLDPAQAQQLRDGLRAGGIRGAAHQVSSETINKLAIAGPAAYCREKVEELIDAGLKHPIFSMLGRSPEDAIEVLTAIEG
jgi:5,10-methylenetetrahydromethanopterin reductase